MSTIVPAPERRDRIRVTAGTKGIERLEARLYGQAFAPHRHDTYAIGLTFAGVQTFHFRGTKWHCLPGQCHILHPDELHDGGTEGEEGFGYRMVYIDPALVQQALGGRSLPFVAQPIVEAAQLAKAHAAEIWDIDEEIDDVGRTELVVAVANLLLGATSGGPAVPAPLALNSLQRVRDLIAANPGERHSMARLERLADLDRWTLARQFRAAFGTSPSRFRTQRQLDHVRGLLKTGAPLAAAAIDAGFADQSHMSRLFKRAYGLTPAKWAAALS